ncbi:MAG: group II intron maturase-specific domain-containing protein, partial [Prolixibacteraceae bacterium]
KIREVSQGWLNYFRMASSYDKLKALDGWLRNRLRYCIWHHWKKPERKRKNLIQLGVDPDRAYQWSRTRMGGWATAQSPILLTTITLERLRKRGYQAMLAYYKKVAPHLNEPLYTRPALQWCERRTPSANYWRSRLLDCMLVFIIFYLFVNHLALFFKSLSNCTNLSAKHKFILFFLFFSVVQNAFDNVLAKIIFLNIFLL